MPRMIRLTLRAAVFPVFFASWISDPVQMSEISHPAANSRTYGSSTPFSVIYQLELPAAGFVTVQRRRIPIIVIRIRNVPIDVFAYFCALYPKYRCRYYNN